jgi:RND superfamily putative drug exporter
MDELLKTPPHQTAPPRSRRARPLVERIARWSIRHRKAAVLGWLAFVGAAVLAGQLLGTQSQPQYDPGQAGHGEQMLHALNVNSPPAESVLVQQRLPGGAGQAPGILHELRRAVDAVATALDGMPRAARDVTATTPAGAVAAGASGHVSASGRSALVTFKVAGPPGDADSTVSADMAAVARIQARFPALLVSEAGGASTDAAGNALLAADFRKTEVSSVPITLILLVAVFGALIAAGIPVLLAGTAVTAAVSLLAIPSRWLPIGSGTAEMVLIIGMAVGVDYSLFYLRREREERAAGLSEADALHVAAATSGRSIVVSGLTVMISMAGLFLTGIEAFTGMALGTIIVVGVAVAGSLTVLPALLSMLGPWADRGRIPFLGRRRTAARPSRLWTALVRRVVVHPIAWGMAAVVALLALAAPALGMRIGNPQIDLPANLPIVQTLDKISLAFPGRPAPAEVVVTGQGMASPAMRGAVEALARRASAAGPIDGPVTAHAVAAGRGVIIFVPLAGSGMDSVSNNALDTLRNQILPATLGKVRDVSFAVTGDTAVNHDWSSVLHARAPIVFVVVAMLAFGVLTLAFRSVLLPLVSILLNLLSLGAAYGLITLIFQDGHLQGPLGFTSYGAIAQWVPLFMFVFLFGLSMDYHVFILSRIREHWKGGASTSAAVVGGISSSAGVVTSAAIIMVAVFSIFATLSFVDVKTLGVGLAFAVLIDATVVRGILMPAAMTLLGERTWYLPRWLNWLPGSGQ